MKINIAKIRRPAGVLLIECLVYISLFALLTSIGLAAFYLCWNQSKAVIYATDDINTALRAGERWRADVRIATSVSFEQTVTNRTMRIAQKDKKIFYCFEGGAVRRQTSVSPKAELLLPQVIDSQMSAQPGEGLTACRWELQLAVRRPETQLPLLFTFEAAQIKP